MCGWRRGLRAERTFARCRGLKVGSFFQCVFMLEHPCAQPRTFGACSHFLGKDVGIASSTGDISNDGAQQQGDDLHMPQRDVMCGASLGERIVPAERV
ncbi:hypothetical protein D3C85_1496990 [compost metagenome]